MPEVRQGLFTPEQEQTLGKMVDDAVKFDNVLVETLDGIAFRQAIKLLDNLVFDKIPEDIRANYIIPIVDDALEHIDDIEILGEGE